MYLVAHALHQGERGGLAGGQSQKGPQRGWPRGIMVGA